MCSVEVPSTSGESNGVAIRARVDLHTTDQCRCIRESVTVSTSLNPFVRRRRLRALDLNVAAKSFESIFSLFFLRPCDSKRMRFSEGERAAMPEESQRYSGGCLDVL